MTYSSAQQMAEVHARIERVEDDKLYVWDLSRRGLTRGLAEEQRDTEGRVLKNPDPIPGETYLLWSDGVLDNASPVFVATYCGMHGEEHLFATHSYVLQPVDETSALDIRTTTSQHTIENKVWVKARFDAVQLSAERMDASVDRADELRRELAAEEVWFDEFSHGLNELAETNSWCGTYDEIVRAVGLPGREKDYWVDVEVECTITDNNPSGRLDERLEAHYGVAFSTTRVEMSGKVTVRVNGITATDHSEAQNAVTADDVRSELDSLFSGDVEMNEWEVKDSGEED